MLLFPGCKINIGLDVVARRSDGYHDIETLMIPIAGLSDAVELIAARENGLTVVGTQVDCPPQDNLCMKALRMVQSRSEAGPAHIWLQKGVPSGAGLGGGSADAAAVIKAADAVLGIGMTVAQMECMAADLGSDVPFFITGRPVIASGRGEIFSPCPASVLDALSGKYIVIAKPDISVNTASAYSGITPKRPATALTDRLTAGIGYWRASVGNAFEKTIFAQHPLLEQIKEGLYKAGAIYASMSGSGSTIYGIFECEPELQMLRADVIIYKGVIPSMDIYGS